MKKIENKKITVGASEGTYGELLKIIANIIPQGSHGLLPTEIKARLKIIDAIDVAGDFIELDDDSAEIVKTLAPQSRWAIVDKGIIEFLDAIEKL